MLNINTYREKMNNIENHISEDTVRTNWYLYLIILAVNIVSFSSGVAYGWASPSIPKMDGTVDRENNPLSSNLTSSEKSWIASLHSLGSAFGPFILGPLVDRIGRRYTLICSAIPIAFSNAVMAFSNRVWFFYVARLVNGIGIGAVYTTVPMYVGEVAEDKNRGALGCVLSVIVALGILYGYTAGAYLSVMWFNFTNIIPLVIGIVALLVIVPESPYFLVMKNRIAQAEKSLTILRRTDNKELLGREMVIIKQNVEKSFDNQGGLLDIFRIKGLRRGFCIIIGITLFQQLTGINALLAFMQSILVDAGISLPSELAVIAIGSVQFISCSITPSIVDKLGRRILLLISILGTGICQLSVGIYFYLQSSGHLIENISWLPVLSLILFVVSFNLGLGPLTWVVVGELFPQNVKSIAASTAAFVCLFMAFFTTFIFQYLLELIGTAPSFWLFFGCCVCGFIFLFVLLPETKGKSLHDIQIILNK